MSSDIFGAGENSFLSQSVQMQADTTNNLSMYDLNPEEVLNEDGISKMKAAFIYHLKKNSTKCSAVLMDLLNSENDTNKDCDIDAIVVAIAKDIAEDVPAADPRWEDQIHKAQKHALGSSKSMQLIQQLREKNLALNHFIDFLHSTEIWERVIYFQFAFIFYLWFLYIYSWDELMIEEI